MYVSPILLTFLVDFNQIGAYTQSMSHALLERQTSSPRVFQIGDGIRSAQNKKPRRRLETLIGQWEILIVLFKHNFQIPMTLGQVPANDVALHLNALDDLIKMGESLFHEVSITDAMVFADGDYSVEFIQANLRYLKDKHHQWNINIDPAKLEADRATIWDELSKAHL